LNALELRQMVTSQGDDNMTTDTQAPVAPKIEKPAAGIRVENPVRFSGTGIPDAIVHVVTVIDNRLVLRVPVLSNGTWVGSAHEDLNGLITVRAYQTHNQLTSPVSPELTFIVK
jgi:hypothetical protein